MSHEEGRHHLRYTVVRVVRVLVVVVVPGSVVRVFVLFVIRVLVSVGVP